MRIAVLLGSPNRTGSSHILADYFRQGAEEAGHRVEMIGCSPCRDSSVHRLYPLRL